MTFPSIELFGLPRKLPLAVTKSPAIGIKVSSVPEVIPGIDSGKTLKICVERKSHKRNEVIGETKDDHERRS